MTDIQILIDYHKEQLEEAIACNEFEQVKLHDYLLSVCRTIQSKEIA